MAKAKKRTFNVKVFLNTVDGGRTVATYRKDQGARLQVEAAPQGVPAPSDMLV